MITEIEQQMIQYKEDNEEFLKDFHKIYHIQYKALNKPMITKAIQMNKITGYSDYEEYCSKYLQLLGEGSEQEGVTIYIEYYSKFIEVMEQQLKHLKIKYNRDDSDIYTAYELKTVWSFYNGFMIEKTIKKTIAAESEYMLLLNREKEEQQYIDTELGIDLEVCSDLSTIGLQIKSYTYLNLNKKEKQKHITKQNEYKKLSESAEVYYIIYKGDKPIFHINYKNNVIPYKSYLFSQQDIMEQQDIKAGTYKELIKELDNRVWLEGMTHSLTH